jgi:hypothetical protein
MTACTHRASSVRGADGRTFLIAAALRAGAVIGWAYGGLQGTPQGPGAGKGGAPVAQELSPEAALAEVQSYASMDLDVDQFACLRDILAIKRDDTARQFTGI